MATITLGLHSPMQRYGLAVPIIAVFRIQRFETVRSVGLQVVKLSKCNNPFVVPVLSKSGAFSGLPDMSGLP